MDRQQHYDKRLRGSSLSERLVATWMLLSGKQNFVMVYNKTITPDFEHRMDHVDAGDLRVNGRKVEVKHLSRSSSIVILFIRRWHPKAHFCAYPYQYFNKFSIR